MATLDEIKAFLAGLPANVTAEVQVYINVDAQAEPAPDDGEDPPAPDPKPAPVGEVSYKVNVPDKTSKRAKVRPFASPSAGEIDFVYHDEVVYGPGTETSGFIYVTRRQSGAPLLPGFVDKAELIKV